MLKKFQIFVLAFFTLTLLSTGAMADKSVEEIQILDFAKRESERATCRPIQITNLWQELGGQAFAGALGDVYRREFDCRVSDPFL